MRLPWSSESRRARRVRHNKALVQVPFLGREALLESLDAHLQAAQDGAPQYVVLEGVASSGKSSLLTELTLLRCRSAKYFVSRVNVDGCVSEWACLARLFDAMQDRSEAVLKRLYDDSKRIRKALSTDWGGHAPGAGEWRAPAPPMSPGHEHPRANAAPSAHGARRAPPAE
jgi:hypothetical protein